MIQTDKKSANDPSSKPNYPVIILEKWVPALITACVGGLLVALVAPILQANYAKQQAFSQRRLELWESIGENLTNYIQARSRLNAAARYQSEKNASGEEVDEEFRARKEAYVQARDTAKNRFEADFLLAEFFFPPEVSSLMKEFQDWHARYAKARLPDLPPDEEYSEWRQKIMAAAHKHLEN